MVATGFSYWQLPYSQIALPTSLFGIGLLISLFTGIALRAARLTSFNETALTIGAAIPTVVLIRIVIDLLANPKTHNLWPFEIIIATLSGLIVGVIAAAVGNFFNLRDKSKNTD